MQVARMNQVVLSQADIRDFAIYDQSQYELFLRMHVNKKQLHINYTVQNASLIANCWILNLLGDNK